MVRLLTALTIAISAAPTAFAALLSMQIVDPFQINAPGTTYTFSGTITNMTGADPESTDLFLNFDGYDPVNINPNQVLGAMDFIIPNGATSGVVDLFTLDLSPTADPAATYFTDVTVEDFTTNNISDVQTVVIAPVPEPAAWTLLVCAGVALSIRSRLRALAIVALAATAFCSAQTTAVQFSTGVTGQALTNPNLLTLEIPLVNEGPGQAANVTVTDIKLNGAVLQQGAVPTVIGMMQPSQVATLHATYDRSALTFGGKYLLTVRGTYAYGTATYGFSVNQILNLLPANTPTGDTVAQTRSGTIQVAQGPYSPGPSTPDLDDANPSDESVPVGPSRAGPPLTPEVTVDETAASTMLAAAADPNAVTLVRNTSYRDAVTSGFSTEVNDPSAASNGNVVLATGNTFAVLSTDGGKTFSFADPTTIFPNTDTSRLCCDQIVVYSPQIQRFIWLLQYRANAGKNMLRLAWATSDNLKTNGLVRAGWIYTDLTSDFFALGRRWMDFPDLAIGNNHLYISVNLLDDSSGTAIIKAALVARIALSDIQNGTPTWNWFQMNGYNTARVIQNTGDTGYWASQDNNSQMHLWEQKETSTSVSQRELAVPQWPNNQADYQSITPAPDKSNWLADIKGPTRGAITGSTRSDNLLWFAWTAAKGNYTTTDSPPQTINISQPHIRVAVFNFASYRLAKHIVLWNRNYAQAYPALATNGDGEIGISYAYGGTSKMPDHAVGFLSGVVSLKKTTASNTGATRWGDYMSIRPQPGTNLFTAAGHGQTGVFPDPHYVLFGRASDAP